ncbi:MAG: peptidylprolyl isomerase [Flavobacteriaceae bacterium]|nr:peptidylprolyl isomerase [Flavobacteriaceae bacterium]
MAILSKIRERSVFLIVIIGLALFAFVASPSDIMKFFDSSKINAIGEVNGEDLSREEFAIQVEAYKANYGGNVSQTQAMNAVWENMVSEQIFKTQLETSGIVIGEQDVWQAIISLPAIQDSPIFKNEAGLFSEDKVKEYIVNLKESAEVGDNAAWLEWLRTEKSIRTNLERTTYSNLVSIGLGATLKEGERAYQFSNMKITGQFVQVPFTSIEDSKIAVSDEEILKYIKKREKEFKTEALRDIKYVKFDIKASKEDEASLRDELTYLLTDREEYNAASKSTEFVEGFRSTSTPIEYVNKYSDSKYSDKFIFKSDLNGSFVDTLFSLPVGSIYGPYTDGISLKVSKIIEKKEVPSVNASHILISFTGAERANPAFARTKEEAQAKANELLALAKTAGTDFGSLAMANSEDGSAQSGGNLGWFKEGDMVPEFNDFVFKNGKGSIGLVETIFGFHIIKIEDTKSETGIKVASLSRKVLPSEATENIIFENAETFASQLAEGKDFTTIATEKKYEVVTANDLKGLDEFVVGLNSQRQIVIWAFEKDSKVGSTKRFDIDQGYVVTVVTGITPAGLAPVSKVADRVKPILIKEKKAALIKEKMVGSSLEEIAKATSTNVKLASLITQESPLLQGVGYEPAVVGTMASAKIGKVVNGIIGNQGVYAVSVTTREVPSALPNYELNRKNVLKQLQSRGGQLYNALKEATDIKDYRTNVY